MNVKELWCSFIFGYNFTMDIVFFIVILFLGIILLLGGPKDPPPMVPV